MTQLGESQLDEEFGFRSRNEDGRADAKTQTVEVGAPEQVGDGLAARAAHDQCRERGELAARQRLLRVGKQVGVRASADMLDEQPGVEPVELPTRQSPGVADADRLAAARAGGRVGL